MVDFSILDEMVVFRSLIHVRLIEITIRFLIKTLYYFKFSSTFFNYRYFRCTRSHTCAKVNSSWFEITLSTPPIAQSCTAAQQSSGISWLKTTYCFNLSIYLTHAIQRNVCMPFFFSAPLIWWTPAPLKGGPDWRLLLLKVLIFA